MLLLPVCLLAIFKVCELEKQDRSLAVFHMLMSSFWGEGGCCEQ